MLSGSADLQKRGGPSMPRTFFGCVWEEQNGGQGAGLPAGTIGRIGSSGDGGANQESARAEGEARSERVKSGGPTKGRLLQCLGGAWPRGGPLEPVLEGSEQKDGYRLERITYLAEPGERVAAYLLLPDDASQKRPAPGVCVWHQHNGAYEVGKDEPAGLKLGPMHHTGVALAREGYAVLCPDAAGFGERNGRGRLHGRDLEHYLFGMYVAEGKCLAWKNILDMRRAVDLDRESPRSGRPPAGLLRPLHGFHTHLAGRTVGAAAEGARRQLLHADLRRHGAYRPDPLLPQLIPGWRRYGDIPDIVGMIAPRALHLNFGETDSGSPIEEVKAGVETSAGPSRPGAQKIDSPATSRPVPATS